MRKLTLLARSGKSWHCQSLFLLVILSVIAAGCRSETPITREILATSPPAASSADFITPAITPFQGSPTREILLAPTLRQETLEPPVIPTATMSPDPTYNPASWKESPVIPALHPEMIDVYQNGLLLGNHPDAFSKVGDCGSDAVWYLTDFDRGERYYRLGDYAYLTEVIQAFPGSFERTSLAAKQGFNAASLFAPLWSDKTQCLPDEGPLACEYRLHEPVIAFFLVGSNDVYHVDKFAPGLRRAVEFSLSKGVIPILSTKADNLEGDHSLNETIALIAAEYHVPLINYWKAVQSLPAHGLQDDGVHLTYGGNRFDDAQAMQKAWPIRNLTTLQTLDIIWRELQNH